MANEATTAAEDCPTLHFPAACPECKHVAGMPYMAKTMKGNGVIVSLRCLECGHAWDCTFTATSPYTLTGNNR